MRVEQRAVRGDQPELFLDVLVQFRRGPAQHGGDDEEPSGTGTGERERGEDERGAAGTGDRADRELLDGDAPEVLDGHRLAVRRQYLPRGGIEDDDAAPVRVGLAEAVEDSVVVGVVEHAGAGRDLQVAAWRWWPTWPAPARGRRSRVAGFR